MSADHFDTDVMIIGAGPTGLMLACQLLRYGISFRIVDKQANRAKESRALVVHARSMEVFKNLGLGPAMAQVVRPSIGTTLIVDGKKRADLNFQDIAAEDTPFPSVYFLPQSETERVMIAHLEKNGVTIEREVWLTGFTQASGGVNITLQSAKGENIALRSRLIVGCDGAHSAVRHILGLDFAGGAYEQTFLLADAKIDWAYPKEKLQVFMRDQNLLVHFPLTDKVDRLILSVKRDGPPRTTDPTLEEIQTLVRKISGVDATVSDPIWLANFRLSHRAVKTYKVENAYLAGDAAHIHSPAGGQGMNTGLQDAANLAWKIAFVQKGIAPASLLATYQDERPPVAQVLLKSTDRIFRLTTAPNLLFARLRNILIPPVAKFVMVNRRFRKRAFRFVSQLSIRYSENSFICEDAAGADEFFLKGPRAGTRAPDAPVMGSTLFDRFMGPDFHIVAFCSSAREVEAAREKLKSFQDKRPWLKTHIFTLKDDGEVLYTRYGVSRSAIYLIRPDGYIAFRSYGSSFQSLKNYLAKFNTPRA